MRQIINNVKAAETVNAECGNEQGLVTASKSNFISLSSLKDRGWTDKMIRDYGLEPDMEKTNPHCRSAAPMKLYDLNRIVRIESGTWFQEQYAASLSRRKGAKKAVQTKYDKMMEYIQSIPVKLPEWTRERAFEEAVNQYNALWAYRGREDKYITDYRNLDSETLERITKNMFRHACTDYDDTLYECYGKVGVETAHAFLQDKINSMVHEKYFAA